VILESAPTRASFIDTLAGAASSGKNALLLAPVGAGKTHALVAARESLRARGVPFVFIDLFTAASTPERLLEVLAKAVSPFMGAEAASMEAQAATANDRRLSAPALLRLLDLLADRAPALPFVWLIDEVTEIRSLAYFPGLNRVETPFAKAIRNSRGSILTSSYLGLARDLFPDPEPVDLPPLVDEDLERIPGLRGGRDGASIDQAILVTGGFAATLLPLLADLRESHDLARSLARLLGPGSDLELTCRRHYEVLLMRSRGYAVAKRAAEVVAGARDLRLTDLFPKIGRTAGASRQYLRWLVEVGLLIQTRKRYDFADPVLGLWASLYLGRGAHPTEDEIGDAVRRRLAPPPIDESAQAAVEEAAEPVEIRARRPDRFEEID